MIRKISLKRSIEGCEKLCADECQCDDFDDYLLLCRRMFPVKHLGQIASMIKTLPMGKQSQLLLQLSKHSTPLQFAALPMYLEVLVRNDHFLIVFGNLIEFLQDEYVSWFLCVNNYTCDNYLAWAIAMVAKYHPSVFEEVSECNFARLFSSAARQPPMLYSCQQYLFKAFVTFFQSGLIVSLQSTWQFWSQIANYALANDELEASEIQAIVIYDAKISAREVLQRNRECLAQAMDSYGCREHQ